MMDATNVELTTTAPTIGNRTITPAGDWWPYQPWPYTGNYLYQVVTANNAEPAFCIGKAHVFECDHERKCKCGKVTRVMPRVDAKKR